MKISNRHLLWIAVTIIMLNGCCPLHKFSSGVRFATDGYEKNSPEYCMMLFEDYEIYMKLYRNYNDVASMFHYLDLLDSAREYCNDIERICYYEYDLLMTLGLYQDCVDRIQSIPDSLFKFPYNKFFIINTAQSAINQINNDTLARNRNNMEIVESICAYWNKKYNTELIFDQDFNNYQYLANRLYEDDTMRRSGTLIDFYIARARVENIDELQNEISKFAVKNEFDSIFISNLSLRLQQMKDRKNYHFEYDIIINPHIYRAPQD